MITDFNSISGIATQKRKEAARAELAEKKKADQLFKDKMKVKAEKKRAANEDHAQHYIKTVITLQVTVKLQFKQRFAFRLMK